MILLSLSVLDMVSWNILLSRYMLCEFLYDDLRMVLCCESMGIACSLLELLTVLTESTVLRSFWLKLTCVLF